MWFRRVRSVLNSSMGASWGRETSISRESGAAWKGISWTCSSRPVILGPAAIKAALAASPPQRLAGGVSHPPCSARRNASCTRLIVFLRETQLLLGDVIVDNRSGNDHHRGETCGGPAEPGEASAAAHYEIVLEQRNAAEDGHLGIGTHVLQVLQRRVFHFPGAGDHQAEKQAETGADGDDQWAFGFGGADRQGRGVENFEHFALLAIFHFLSQPCAFQFLRDFDVVLAG